MSKLKIAVLVSGGGTNLQAIIDKIASGEITNTEIALVFSNNRKAYALERAKMAGIPAKALSPKQFENREAFNDAVLEVIEESKADLIVLAGCLPVLLRKGLLWPDSTRKGTKARCESDRCYSSFCG